MHDIKYIMNIMKYNKVCKCDLNNGVFEEMEKKEGISISKGIYSEVLDSTVKLVGLVGSKEGPILFLDREQYVITNTDFDFIQQSTEGLKGKFIAYINGKKTIELEYKKPFSDFDVWSSEEDIDVFQWLLRFCENLELKNKFLRIYTIS